MGSSSGIFSVKTTWEAVRTKKEKKELEKLLWVKGLPFKINVFFGRHKKEEWQ